MTHVTEAHYPLTFRATDTQALAQHLAQHDSVALIGMKRVGIGNFLRFFLNQSQIPATYLGKNQHMLIVVDFNNLVERTLYAFWMLTLKRIVDAIEESDFSAKIKDQSRATFTQSIQLSDFFFTLESVHKLINLLIDQDKYITLFFLRFDRLKDVISNEFFANILGLKDSGKHLTYVFTSFRPLYEIVPTVFTRSALAGFCEEMYLKPAADSDMKVILATFQERYGVQLLPKTTAVLLNLAGGNVQYLHLMLIKLKNEKIDPTALGNEAELKKLLTQEEEVHFLSEEVFTSLTPNEQEVLLSGEYETLLNGEKNAYKYLWDTGILTSAPTPTVFSPLFESYLQEVKKTKQQGSPDFTKKEHLLFSLLKEHQDQLVERETIIEAVWPDEVELGVSDWSVDRLVSRVRTKLKAQNSEYKIVTVITRGYKLVKKA